MARLARHFRPEGEHRERLQPSGAGALHRQPLHRHPTRGTLFGLQESNPVDPSVAYGGNADEYGTTSDFMVGKRIGGINVFGGGLALYDSSGELIGAVGVSGDTSCADHNIAWKLRDALVLDFVPGGVNPVSGDDNIVYDIQPDGSSPSGWGHPECSTAATTVADGLPTNFPLSTP